ncbi:MAG: YceD family protein [Cellvibrionaceae bacterium]|nr:YceD family protein [Cellvibrionaceae bacterium]
MDPRKFAQQEVVLQGTLPLAELERLSALAAGDQAEITAELEFGVDDQRHRLLTGKVSAKLQLTCERCMEACDQHIEGELALGIVWDEEQAKQLPRRLDAWIAPEGVSDIYEVIEEEILLGIPMGVYHDHQCVDLAHYSVGGDDGADETAAPAAERRNNPFQVLEQLKGTPK